jgi:hypothetical protein
MLIFGPIALGLRADLCGLAPLAGFKLARRLITNRAMQTPIVIINFDVFEDLAPAGGMIAHHTERSRPKVLRFVICNLSFVIAFEPKVRMRSPARCGRW